MKEKYEIFVPGRLCLLGEHSDWAGRYRISNNEIVEGYAIVTGIEEGIYATVSYSDKFEIINKVNNSSFEEKMDIKKLTNEAQSGSYYSYMCGVASYMKEKYNVNGLKIEITKVTLPIKKGLSSSAACCVLTSRAFNKIYHLQLSTLDEMECAYYGEIKTPSRCGRMDQACAFGIKPILLTFDGDKIDVDKLDVKGDFYWVFADLMSSKNTKKILSDLNEAYPFAETEIDYNVQKYLGPINKKNIQKAIEYLKNGDAVNLGKLMIETQEDFDKYVAPASSELKSPILHKTLNNQYIKSLTYGGKGVGSQGDGTVQFLAKDKESQEKLMDYLQNELHMDSYKLTIKENKEIKKAVIPIAGMGSRMYPITKVIRKDFLPVYDKGMIKPAIMVLLEELYDAGIEDIYLVIDKEDYEMCNKMFYDELPKDLLAKLSPEMLKYEKKVHDIGKIIHYIYQEEKLGLGHAVYLCKEDIGNNPFLLLLGDQLYNSYSNESCISQVLASYKINGKTTLSACETPLSKVSSYGIMKGNKVNDNQFEITSFVEKPSIDYAKQYLGTQDEKGNQKYYSVFGIYALNSNIFDILEKMVQDYNKMSGEIQITTAIDKIRELEGAYAFIPNGVYYDIGNPENYKYTWENYK